MAQPDAAPPDAVPPDADASHEVPAGSFRLDGSVSTADVDAVCARASRGLAAATSEAVLCDLAGLDGAALPVVDLIARLSLLARRSGHDLRLEHAGTALVELLILCGLEDLLGDDAPCREAIDLRGTGAGRRRGRPRSGVEVSRQAEQREEALRVQEEGDPGDPVAVDLEDLQRPGIEPTTGSRLVLTEAGGAVDLDRQEP